MSHVQISLQLYASDTSNNPNNKAAKEYMYSKPYTKKEADDILADILTDVQNGKIFVELEKHDGMLYVRSDDIRTIFIKEADMSYVGR